LQISEIFNLFDTDKGGSIDLRELDFAMNALGFQVKHSTGVESKHSKKAKAAMNAIAADGSALISEDSVTRGGSVGRT
jgi:hypothetical protein